MADIDQDVRFDHAAASRLAAVLREAIRETEHGLADRRSRHQALQSQWSGYARDWYNERSASFDVVAVSVVEYLRGLLRGVAPPAEAAQAEQRRRVVARQERARLEAEAQQRRMDEAEAARRAAAAKTVGPQLPSPVGPQLPAQAPASGRAA